MATVITPYLTRTTFVGMFRALSSEEGALVDLLLIAAKMWIDDRIAKAGRPALAADDPMAILVSYQVVRNALPAVPEMSGRTQYTIVTDDRTESGTIAAAMDLLEFSDHQLTLLGLSATAGPHWGGMDGDFGHDYPSRSCGNIAAVVLGDIP